ncbi:MAG: ABC transporter substrate-binding protein [Candidatus Rokubacteria bacterium]|nr:ABC transporter substrate-binding protein [Candidatus Rokubacteria bacterium]
MRVLVHVVLAVSLVGGVFRPAEAGRVADQLKIDIDRVLQVVHDPGLRGDVQERRLAVHRISARMFDFDEMARRTLGRYWTERTASEREDFIHRLGLLVASHLVALEARGGDTIEFVGESIQGDEAMVETRVVPIHGRGIALDYRLLRHDGERWLIYDVVVNNASLVGNYGSQFRRIIHMASYEKLVEKLSR